MLTPGQIFQKRRRMLRKPISTVSVDTRIQEKYLRSLEEDKYQDFDSPVFASGFVKIYSDYLGLDVEKMLALYRRASTEAINASKAAIVAKKQSFNIIEYFKKKQYKELLTPLNIIIVLTVIVISGLLIYINKQYSSLQQIPSLQITQPTNNSKTDKNQITIKGLTSKNAKVTIKGEPVDNIDGSFEKNETLNNGINIFEIIAVNPNNQDQRKTEVISVTYETSSTTTNPQTNTQSQADAEVYLDIFGEAAWIKLTTDNTQKYAQVLKVGKTPTFKFKDSVEVVSGKPLNTKVYINKKLYTLKINPQTGVASLSCTKDAQGSINCSN